VRLVLDRERDRGLTVTSLTDDVEARLAERLDDVHADERLVLRDDRTTDTTGSGRLLRLRLDERRQVQLDLLGALLVLCHAHILRGRRAHRHRTHGCVAPRSGRYAGPAPRPDSPTGRGARLKPDPVWVRIPLGALSRPRGARAARPLRGRAARVRSARQRGTRPNTRRTWHNARWARSPTRTQGRPGPPRPRSPTG